MITIELPIWWLWTMIALMLFNISLDLYNVYLRRRIANLDRKLKENIEKQIKEYLTAADVGAKK